MNERKPQPAWRKKEGGRPQHQQRGRGGGRRPHQQQRDQQKLPPLSETRAPDIRPVEVTVRDGDIGQALRVLKTRMSKEGLLSELKRRRHAEKPSEKKRRKRREAMKRMRKSKGRKRRQDWWKKGGKRSKVVASVPLPDRQAENAHHQQESSDNERVPQDHGQERKTQRLEDRNRPG
jgi:small subunit ribosomal protein S21